MLEVIFYKIKSYFMLAMCSVFPSIGCATSTEPPGQLNLQLPAGFEISIFAKLDVLPRMMTFSPEGHLYVSSARRNQVLMVPDKDNDGVAESAVLVSKDLNRPNGLVFVGNDLLIANQDGVIKLTKQNRQWSAQPMISGLATGGHSVKTIKIGPDNHLYINVGSSCNVCNETDPTRATILRYTLEGKPAGAIPVVGRHKLPPIWARGLRNAQGFAWHPVTKKMFATNNGADMRSESKNGKVNDDLPPEHVNLIERGNHYGWPHCWADLDNSKAMFTDPNFPGPDGFCQTATPPAIILTSHATPIGITFLDKSQFPEEFKQDAIVSLHGSWNRDQLSGYKLVRIKFTNGQPTEVVDFATGWLSNNRAWGRPVDAIVGPDGALYVTDDRTGYIYRVTYKKP